MEYLEFLRSIFEQHRDQTAAQSMKRYLKNHFEFFGIKSPKRKLLVKEMIASLGLPTAEQFHTFCYDAFQQPERELQYAVGDLGEKLIKKLPDSYIKVIEDLIGQKSWWDSVDFLSPKLAGAIFKRNPEMRYTIPTQWIASPNYWYQRAAILYQLNYKDSTDQEQLFEFITFTAKSKVFFVRKAAGWALRQYARINPSAVRQFVQTNDDLSKLTIREALKHLN